MKSDLVALLVFIAAICVIAFIYNSPTGLPIREFGPILIYGIAIVSLSRWVKRLDKESSWHVFLPIIYVLGPISLTMGLAGYIFKHYVEIDYSMKELGDSVYFVAVTCLVSLYALTIVVGIKFYQSNNA